MKPKVAFFETQDWENELVVKTLNDFEVLFFDERLSEEHLDQIREVEVLSVFIYSSVTRQFIEAMPNLKLVATRSTGFDHIDMTACKERDIIVSNVPRYGENTIAEHTFALILALSRNVHKSYVRVMRNDYSIEGLRGFDLKGRTLGVVGTGNIGINVIKIARGFGMKVLAFDVNQNHFLADILAYEYTELDTLLARSDIISLHIPYNKHTHHLINGERLAKMKKGAILINTARGGVVDTDALLEALNSKQLGGLGIDVLEGEEYIKEEEQLLKDPEKREVWGQIIRDQIILRKENVVFTPHIAFYSQEALERITQTTLSNICRFYRGQPENVVGGRG